ncbi:MAG: hypothetical protein KDC80_16835 [Saprospiraceae bacterium]|nr:hypothetical protein [Saprospiraceae bacterium]
MKDLIRSLYIALIVASLTPLLLPAQTASDILRFSNTSPQGTARAIGIGGAIGGLGGDFTSLSVNPAGIGGYWKSEFMVSPVFVRNNTRSSLNGGLESQELARKFGLSNVGIVFTNTSDRGAWKAVSLGIGLNKLGNYEQEFFYQNETQGSIVDRFAGRAFGLTPDQLDGFESGPAYSSGAIYDIGNDLIYETDFDNQDQEVFQKRQLVKSEGYNNELVIGFGGNLKNKVLIGGSVGIPFVSYSSEKSYEEIDDLDVIPAFNYLNFNEYLTTEGGGVNLKLGAIFKLNNNFRLGAAFHSPTYLALTDRFTTDFTYEYNEGAGDESFTNESPEGEFEYGLTTPWKAVANAAWIIGKSGFISTDIEYIDYSSAKYDFTTNSDNVEDRIYQDEVNAEIKESYKAAVNIKLGGELAYEGFRFRLGGQLVGSPFVDDNSFEKVLTAGIGVRGNKAFLDLGFSHSSVNELYLPYQIEGAPLQNVENRIGKNNIVLTVGFKI